MAALGFEDHGMVVTRGWYRVAPGKCVRPDLIGKPRRLYSFGEAVGADGQPIVTAKSADRPVSWGGSTVLDTRPTSGNSCVPRPAENRQPVIDEQRADVAPRAYSAISKRVIIPMSS